MSVVYTETELVARVDGLTVAHVRAFVQNRCLQPVERDGRLAFVEADIARAQLLAELASDFDLDPEGAALVLALVDQIHGLRQRLRALGDAMAAEPEDVRARIRSRLGSG